MRRFVVRGDARVPSYALTRLTTVPSTLKYHSVYSLRIETVYSQSVNYLATEAGSKFFPLVPQKKIRVGTENIIHVERSDRIENHGGEGGYRKANIWQKTKMMGKRKFDTKNYNKKYSKKM